MLSNVQIEHLEQCMAIGTYTNKLSSPIVIQDLVYCVAENGDIIRINNKGEIDVVFTILGQPSSLAFKDGDNMFLISDFAHQCIFSREENTNYQIHNLITQYNDHAFVGPNSIKVGVFTKNIYFTDSGPFQQTSIQNKLGSVFVIRGETEKLKCLSFRNLAYPAGLETDDQQKYLLVCEMGENRILKFILDQNLNGNYTIFHQFYGRFGPSAIFNYDSKFYVSLYEFNDITSSGLIAVLSNNGDIVQRLSLQTGAEISGIYIYQQNTEKEEEVILVCQKNVIYRVPLKKGQQQSKLSQSIVLSKN